VAALHISRATLYRLMVAHGMHDPADTHPHDEDGDDAPKEMRQEESV
jgi:hypothetical protein